MPDIGRKVSAKKAAVVCIRASSTAHRIFHISDLVREIFRHLYLSDLYCCARVNRLWSDLSLDFLWRGSVNRSPWMTPPSRTLNDIHHDSPDRLIRYLQRAQYMRIDCLVNDYAYSQDPPRKEAEFWPCLESLPPSTSGSESLWKSQALIVEHMGGSEPHQRALVSLLHQNLLSIVFRDCDSETLDVGATFQSIQQRCPRLRSLQFQCGRHLDRGGSEKWLAFLEAMPSITHIWLPFPFSMSATLASHIVQRPNLQYLELTVTPLNAASINEAIQKVSWGQCQGRLPFSRLRGLNLALRSSGTLLLRELLGHCHRLEHFSLVACDGTEPPLDVDEMVFQPLCKRAELRQVSIRAQFAKDLDASSVIEWTSQAPLLYQLDLTHSPIGAMLLMGPRIRRLIFQKHDAEALATALPSIKHLKLDFRSSLNCAELLAFSGKKCPRLETLSLGLRVDLYDLAQLLALPASPEDSHHHCHDDISQVSKEREGTSSTTQPVLFPSLRDLCFLDYTAEEPEPENWRHLSPREEDELAVEIEAVQRRGRSQHQSDTIFQAEPVAAQQWTQRVGAMLEQHMPQLETLCRHRIMHGRGAGRSCAAAAVQMELLDQLQHILFRSGRIPAVGEEGEETTQFECQFHAPGADYSNNNRNEGQKKKRTRRSGAHRGHYCCSTRSESKWPAINSLQRRYEWYFRSILGQAARLW